MTMEYLDRLHTKKMETGEMTREWMSRFSKIMLKFARRVR